MKIDERLSPRARMLLFSTLEMLRKEISPRFYDQKGADEWLFSQLDLTKNELAQIYKGRGVSYYDGSAVDFDDAFNEYLSDLEFVHDFGNGIQILKVFAVPDSENGYGHIYSSKRDFDLFANSQESVVGYCVVDSNQSPVSICDGCADFCSTVDEAIKDFKDSLEPENVILASRIVDFMKDYDFYEFKDSLEVGETEADVILSIAHGLCAESALSTAEALNEMYLEGEMTSEQEAEVKKIIQKLNHFCEKPLMKASLADQISSAASRIGTLPISSHTKVYEVPGKYSGRD